MDTLEAIEKRHCYRGAFDKTPLPPAHVETLLRAGVAAPSGHNYQTPRFVALTDETALATLGEILPVKVVKTAPLAIVVLSQKMPMENGIDFEFCDYAAATQNILLAVTALGYASVWIDGQLYHEDNARRVAQLVRAPQGLTPRVVLPVGVPRAEGLHKILTLGKSKMAFNERAFYNHF